MKEKELLRIAEEKLKSFNPKQLKNSGFIPLGDLYFPAIYYPPITMYPESDEDKIFAGYKHDRAHPLSVYIHIPFCPKRCLYCHWVVSVGNPPQDMDCYLKNLEKEMELYKKRLGLREILPKSVLIGGGTPTMLSPAQTERLLKSFTARFDLTECRQFTYEVEPSTLLGRLGLERLKIIKDYGVDRISLGVQVFDDEILKRMKRAYTSKDAIKAIKQIRLAGFKSLSIDLIYGYPGCAPKKWIATLKTAFSLDIDACQQYRLRIVPHGDKIGLIKKQFDKSSDNFLDAKQIYIMKELGILFASLNGFKEGSRRVFVRSPKYNSEYLQDHTDRLADVLGLGISAWSNIQGHLSLNTGENLERYYSYLNKGRLPIDRGKIRTEDDQKRWAIALPLKHHGVSKIKYKEITGTNVNEDFGEKIKRLKNFGLLEENEESLILTEKGRFFADEVVIQFYHPDYLPFPKSSYADGELNPYNV